MTPEAEWFISSPRGFKRGAGDAAETRAIGLMSGTSLDDIDVALIETDGERVTHFGPAATDPYGDEAKSVLRQTLEAVAGAM